MNTLINTTVLEDKDLLTIEELSESLRMSHNTIYRISYRGELKPLKYRGRNYWRVEDVKNYLIGKGLLIPNKLSLNDLLYTSPTF